MKRIIQIVTAVSTALFAFIFGNEAAEIPVADLVILLVALALILTVQSAVLLAVDSIVSRRGPPASLPTKAIAAAFVASNAYFTAFCTYDAANWIRIVLAAVAGAVVLAVLVQRRWHAVALFVLPVYVVLSLGLYGYTRIKMSEGARVASAPVRVQSRRNVYLIGQESLHSPKALREIYGVGDLRIFDYLRARGFRVMDRAYSPDIQTLRSYSRMLEFGGTVSEADIKDRQVFRSSNATFASFHESGYRAQFIFLSSYFALDRSLVDYAFPDHDGFYTCVFLPKNFFYFLCHPRILGPLNRVLFGARWLTPAIVRERVGVAAKSRDPWLTIYHNHLLYHTPANHDYNDADAVRGFRARMVRSLRGIKPAKFDDLFDYIIENDPDAVIVTFGDHGASLTRGADLDTPNPVFTQAQVLEDRFGVALAVYPKDFCVNRIREGTSTTFLVPNVIRCLNGNDSPTRGERAQDRTVYWRQPRSLDRYPSASLPAAGPAIR